MEQMPLSMGLSLRAAEFIAVSLFNPKRGETVRPIYQKYKTVFPSCCSSLTEITQVVQRNHRYDDTQDFQGQEQNRTVYPTPASRPAARPTRAPMVHVLPRGSRRRQPSPPAPAGVHTDGYLSTLQSLQALHRNIGMVSIKKLKSIMIGEANEEVKLGLLIVFSEDKSTIKF